MLRPEPMGAGMRRREFLGVLGGAAATWPLAARAQQGERTRRIGMITNLAADRIGAFQQELALLSGT
jgi:putative ABC transport system substrate-binding protein